MEMFKYRNLFFLFLLIILTFCDSNLEEQIVPIVNTTRIYPSLTPTVSDSAYTIVQSLFNKNNLSLANLKVDSLTYDQGYHVFCSQYYGPNSKTAYPLELYINPVIFHFSENENNYTLSGTLIDKVDIDLNPRVTIAQASNVFYDYIDADGWYSGLLNDYLNLEFNAELGIIDFYAGLNNGNHYFVLAWKLTISGSKYPAAYIRADFLQLINYSNGITYKQQFPHPAAPAKNKLGQV